CQNQGFPGYLARVRPRKIIPTHTKRVDGFSASSDSGRRRAALLGTTAAAEPLLRASPTAEVRPRLSLTRKQQPCHRSEVAGSGAVCTVGLMALGSDQCGAVREKRTLGF